MASDTTKPLPPTPASKPRPAPQLRPRAARRWRTGLVALGLVPIALYSFIVTFLAPLSPALIQPGILEARSILWVIAHPDDEAFFFTPTILKLLAQPDVQGSLLCLSRGDYDGLGALRVDELGASVHELGLDGSRWEALDHPDLLDGPDSVWDPTLIQRFVREYAEKWSADAIITFDAYGVSGHANHGAIPKALTSISAPQLPIYSIRSTSLLQKYTSLLSLPYALLHRSLSSTPTSLFINTPSEYLRARRAFAKHGSQQAWFRSLFVVFSRYLWFVEVERVL
ncbi:N-acetylglucosaminylphosphatidylinositol deacetylase [Pseudohyphozyma bogoriensis]|nr:N-acetylglucosaminylphosphatidylinositol deacetylase [Pseudohyphozyma bogoriensis]